MTKLPPDILADTELLATLRRKFDECVKAGLCTAEYADEVMALLSSGDPMVNEAFTEALAQHIVEKYKRGEDILGLGRLCETEDGQTIIVRNEAQTDPGN